MTNPRFTKKYDWYGNYVRLDDVDMAVAPPVNHQVLCVREQGRPVGYIHDGKFISFVEHQTLAQDGKAPPLQDLVIKTEERCILTQDIWKGEFSPWMHEGAGRYRGYFRIPPVDEAWSSHNRYPINHLYFIILNNPKASLNNMGTIIPGRYLAEPSIDDYGDRTWKVHTPGFRFRSTAEWSVLPRTAIIPGIYADFWIQLPNVMQNSSFQ